MATNRQIKLPTSGSSTYTNLTPMPEKFGGYPIGTTFDNVSISDVLDGLLYPYQVPTFGNFSISGQTTILECGVAVSGSSRSFVWGTTNPSNIKPNSIEIKDITNSVVLESGLANTGSKEVSFSNITKTTTSTTHQWRIIAQNTQDTYFQRSFYVTWYDPFYYGSGAKGLTVGQIQQLTKHIVNRSDKTWNFNPSSQVYYFAYPKSYGLLSSILDPNGFEIKSDFDVRTETFTTNGTYFRNTVPVEYYVYEFKNLTTQTNFVITFKF